MEPAPTDLVALFKATQRDHGELRLEHAALQRKLVDAQRDLGDREGALTHAEAAARRANELVASLRATVQQYVGMCTLNHEAAADGGVSAEREDVARREAAADERHRRLETQLATRDAEIQAVRSQLAEADAVRKHASSLESERDEERGAARRSEHKALEQEALVREHVKRAASAREAQGRNEMDYQRRCERRTPAEREGGESGG